MEMKTSYPTTEVPSSRQFTKQPNFGLSEGMYFVSGALNGAILDTRTGNVYSVNSQACKVLNQELEDQPFWRILQSMGIAGPSKDSSQSLLPKLNQKDRLRFIWFEVVTNECNERCIHCYADSMPGVFRKINRNLVTESRTNKNKSVRCMNHQDWLRVITEAGNEGCKSCQFIGGEPFLYRGDNGETLLDLVVHARQAGFASIEIFTNATLLTPKKIQGIKDLGVKVAVSLYSDDPATHDCITRTPGSHQRTVDALILLRKAGVETRVETILLRANQHTIESTIAFKKRLGFSGKKPDPLRPTGRGNDESNLPEIYYLKKYGLRLEPNFTANIKKVAHYRSAHPCLYGKACISESGDIYPCVFSRNQIVGNYLDSGDLQTILDDHKLRQIWRLTKDDISVCQDCEYRYVCFDCRPLSEGAADGFASYHTAPYPRCTYNPYTGEWGAGLWKVNEAGVPYYDRSFAADITRDEHKI
jgi:radical SAM protein with 4Fe4S-binding SPASM domain